MKTDITTQTHNQLPIKENWTKPEMHVLGVNEETLGRTFAVLGDVNSFS